MEKTWAVVPSKNPFLRVNTFVSGFCHLETANTYVYLSMGFWMLLEESRSAGLQDVPKVGGCFVEVLKYFFGVC